MLRGLDKKERRAVLQRHAAIFPASGLMIVCAGLFALAKRREMKGCEGG